MSSPTTTMTSSPTNNYLFVDTHASLKASLGLLISARQMAIQKPVLNAHMPLLYIDIEGNNLCRFGTISLVQLHVPILKKLRAESGNDGYTTFVIDVTALGKEAFELEVEDRDGDGSHEGMFPNDAQGVSGGPVSLRRMLESEDIIKCFFDVRNDADALYNLYGIDMAGVVDLQILEVATRKGSKRFLNGLARSIQQDGGLPSQVLQGWLTVKKKGKALFDQARPASPSDRGQGGEGQKAASSVKVDVDFSVFDRRPLSPELLEYSVNDVIHLPRLWAIYDARLTNTWRAKAENESVWRLNLAKQNTFFGKSRSMALGPF